VFVGQNACRFENDVRYANGLESTVKQLAGRLMAEY